MLRQLYFSCTDLALHAEFVPGHGETSTFGHERIESPFVGEKALAKWRNAKDWSEGGGGGARPDPAVDGHI